MTKTCCAGLCINPDTKRPYPISIIEKGLKDIHFSVKPNKNTKQQALEAIPQLKTSMKIERAQMKIRLSVTGNSCKSLAEKAEKMGTVENKEFVANTLNMVRED
jgi:ribosome maturation protein SDO1